jgi:hypothetical protein
VRKLAVRADPDNSNSGAGRFTWMAIRAPPFTKLTSGIPGQVLRPGENE